MSRSSVRSESSRSSTDPSGTALKSQGFGKYQLIRRIATGGMAEIFLAKETGISGFERLLVIKRILPHLCENREFITMFLDEARIAAQLTHPNVVQIYDLGKVAEETHGHMQDHFYIAMEYIHGEDIRKIYNQEVQRGERIPLHFSVHLLAQAAAGLDYAHRRSDANGLALGLVHRDISPQNMLVTYDGHVKVVDFGVAKAANKEAQTRSGVLKGKYSYMSPEQAQGMKIDARTDIFALGVVLYEITCGQRLFKRENELETLHAVIACEVVQPSKIDPAFPPSLERIIMKALAKNPARRQQTAGELASELEQYLKETNKAVTARDVAGYMQDLFADKLAEEILVGAGMWEEDHTDDSRKKEQQDEQQAQRASGGTQFIADEGEFEESASRSKSFSVALDDDGTQNDARSHSRPSRSGSRPSRTVKDERQDDDKASRGWSSDDEGTVLSQATQALTSATGLSGGALQQTAVSSTQPSQFIRAPAARRTGLWIALSAMVTLVGALGVLAAVGVFRQPDISGPVFFDSRPSGAAVYVDGIRVSEGKTPVLVDKALSVGMHHVRFAAEGYQDASGELNTLAGQRLTFTLDLLPKPTPPVATPPVAATSEPAVSEPAVTKSSDGPPAVQRKVERDDDRPRRPSKSGGALGQLAVKASLPLKVYEGRTLLGSTPLLKALPEGSHTLRVVHDASGWSQTRVVNVSADGPTSAEFDVKRGSLRINVQPFANVKIGQFSGETPMAAISLPVGSYKVKLWNPALKKDEVADVRISEGKETLIERNWIR